MVVIGGPGNRNSPGKKRGYVILPVVIPAGVDPMRH